jgi:hypothetical protein
MQISHAKLLIKHFRSMYKDLCFVPYLIHIIINIVKLGCKPNIQLSKAFLQDFLQSKIKNDSVKTSIEVCYDSNQRSCEINSRPS